MDRHLSLQTYVPRPLADWIKGKARDQQVSVSIVIRDQLVEAWQRENEARKRPAALDPVRQVFEMSFLTAAQWFIALLSAAIGLTIASLMWRIPLFQEWESPSEDRTPPLER